MDLIEEIGTPALLEQCAEECVELAHACMKMSRKLRDENPTPILTVDIMNNLQEEAADVLLCIDTLVADDVLSLSAIASYKNNKKERWTNRIEETKRRHENNGL